MPKYEPIGVAPRQDLNELAVWLTGELRRVAAALEVPEFSVISLQELNVEPARIFDGDLIAADGTDFDPGSGRGIYHRRSGAWVLIG